MSLGLHSVGSRDGSLMQQEQRAARAPSCCKFVDSRGYTCWRAEKKLFKAEIWVRHLSAAPDTQLQVELSAALLNRSPRWSSWYPRTLLEGKFRGSNPSDSDFFSYYEFFSRCRFLPVDSAQACVHSGKEVSGTLLAKKISGSTAGGW